MLKFSLVTNILRNIMNIIKKIIGYQDSSPAYSFKAKKEEKDELCVSIINSSSPRAGFYLLLSLSTLIVVAGLIKNSVILIIGGMLVAPLLSPILSVSLSLAIVDFKILIRSILIFLISALTSLLVAIIIGLLIDFTLADIEILKLINTFDIYSWLIPIAAGAAASFTWAKKDLSSSLPGVAVTVTLLPPLAAMGLALSQNNYLYFWDSFVIYFLNVSGIIIGSLIIFLLMGFHKSAKTVATQVEIEEKLES